MTTTIELAERALALKSYLNEETSENTLAAVDLQGRKVEHWSYKVQLVGALVGVIAIVVFAILNMIPAAVVGGVLLLTNLFAAYFLHKFRNFNQLDDYVKEMAARIQQFSDRIQELKDINVDLEEINKEIEVIPNQWHEQIERGKKELLAVHKKFETLKKNYDSVLLKLEKFSTISKTLKDETDSLAQETIKFGSENKLLGDNIKRISDGIEVFQKHNTDILDRNKELDQANQELDRLEKEFSKSLEVISELFEAVKEIYEKNRVMMSAFDKKIGELNKSYPDIKASHDEMQQLNKQIITLKDKVENLLKKETELKELRAFKEANKVEFEAWKKTSLRALK